jgi:hypothetical protein
MKSEQQYIKQQEEVYQMESLLRQEKSKEYWIVEVSRNNSKTLLGEESQEVNYSETKGT